MKTSPIYFLFVLSIAFTAFGCSPLSDHEEEVIFENSEFAEPILIALPNQSSRKRYENVKANPKVIDRGTIPTVGITIGGSKSKDFDPTLMAFLQKEGYLTMETLTQTKVDRYGSRTKQHEFIFYTPKLEKVKVKKSDMFTGRGKNYMKAGHRELKSIDQKEVEEFRGGERLIILFSYTIESDIDGIPSPNREYNGEARAYRAAGEEQWGSVDVDLRDRGGREIMNMINQ